MNKHWLPLLPGIRRSTVHSSLQTQRLEADAAASRQEAAELREHSQRLEARLAAAEEVCLFDSGLGILNTEHQKPTHGSASKEGSYGTCIHYTTVLHCILYMRTTCKEEQR